MVIKVGTAIMPWVGDNRITCDCGCPVFTVSEIKEGGAMYYFTCNECYALYEGEKERSCRPEA